ncbi:hypothetical protein [Flavobacterium sp. LB1P62]|uniref:hypothetical protein n=1 Tax=unclassified Flavobacterium TaxID=196869 RepID=UPI003AAF5006
MLSAKAKSIWRIALEVVKEPLFLLLISCGVLYFLLGNYREGIILLSAIFVIIFISFYQYQKTEKALFMELINDPVYSIAFESEQEEKEIMQRPP